MMNLSTELYLKRHMWISIRAERLWHEAGEPLGKDLDFWLAAEREHDFAAKGQLCVLAPGHCPYQKEEPTTGGRHISICTRPFEVRCQNRATNFMTQTAKEKA